MVEVKINLLVLLLLGEFMLIFMIISLVLMKKIGKMKSFSGDGGNLSGFLGNIIANELETLKAALAALEGSEGEKSSVDKQVLETKMAFAQAADTYLEKSGSDPERYFREVFNSLEDILHEHFSKVVVTPSEGQQDIASIDNTGDSEVLSSGKEEIIRLLRYTEFFDELLKEFSKIKENNEKILAVIEEQAASSEELMQVAMDFTQNNEKIDEYIVVIKREYEYLYSKVDKFDNKPKDDS